MKSEILNGLSIQLAWWPTPDWIPGFPKVDHRTYVVRCIWPLTSPGSSIRSCQTYYAKKKAEGRHHTKALCIVARKLVYRVYAVWTQGRMYDRRPEVSPQLA